MTVWVYRHIPSTGLIVVPERRASSAAPSSIDAKPGFFRRSSDFKTLTGTFLHAKFLKVIARRTGPILGCPVGLKRVIRRVETGRISSFFPVLSGV